MTSNKKKEMQYNVTNRNDVCLFRKSKEEKKDIMDDRFPVSVKKRILMNKRV